jgi:hypothetical protein
MIIVLILITSPIWYLFILGMIDSYKEKKAWRYRQTDEYRLLNNWGCAVAGCRVTNGKSIWFEHRYTREILERYRSRLVNTGKVRAELLQIPPSVLTAEEKKRQAVERNRRDFPFMYLKFDDHNPA